MTHKDALNQFALAANSIRRAIEAMNRVVEGNQYWAKDAKYYRAELSELLSCDDGEAGLESLIRLVAQRAGVK